MDTQPLAERLDRLKRSANTPRTYASVVGQIPDDADPVEWLHERLRASPIGTVLPFRAAVRHHLIALGMSEAEVAVLLPPASGRAGRRRAALGRMQLAEYHTAVDTLQAGSVRTLLQILPRTGLRISEACGLRWDMRETQDDRDGFRIVGKREKERFVPLTPQTAAIFDAWRASDRRAGGDVWVFPGYGGQPLDTSAVRHACITLRTQYRDRTGRNDLDGLSPHVLRHTFCTNAIKVMDVKALQELVGHESMATTARYLHPTVGEVADALARMDG
jgi:integrase